MKSQFGQCPNRSGISFGGAPLITVVSMIHISFFGPFPVNIELSHFKPSPSSFMFRTYGWGCDTSEVEEVCKPLVLHFEGTSVSDCRWLFYQHQTTNNTTIQEKPCCYHNPLQGLSNACSLNQQASTCRGEPDMEVKMIGKNCTLRIEKPNSGDVGRYVCFMPAKSSQPLHSEVIKQEDLECEIRISMSCKDRWMILIDAGLVILFLVSGFWILILSNLVPCFRNFFGRKRHNGEELQSWP